VGRGRRPLSSSNKNNKQLRGKMKKSLLVFTILISMLSVVNVSQANAGCTAENPCGTWAMLDSQGVVTNVIVCQASVCGGGTWAGQTVVPQVAPNPVTHDTTGQGSYIGNKEAGTTVTYSDNRFNIVENSTIVREQTDIDNNSTSVSRVEIPVTSKSFSYEDTINKSYGDVPMSIGLVDESKETKISVLKNSEEETEYESTSFSERKTIEELRSDVAFKNLTLMMSKIQTLIKLLKGWLK
jgi:hypothetical protein